MKQPEQKPNPPTMPRPAKAPEGHEGGTDHDIGERGGPGAGYDKEPEQQKGRGSGVA
jgi:hypothetical protein